MKDKRISTTDTAKLIKEILNDYFPETKFSIRSKKYAGGSSVRVSWTDGPTEKQVKQITNYFEGADFDGMRDLKTYKHKIETDAEGNDVKVKFGPDFVFPSRSYSKTFARNIAQIVIDDWGLDESLLNKIKETSTGGAYWDVMNIKPEGWTMDLQTKFHRYRCQIEANPDGSIKKKRVSADYLKNLAAKAYAGDDESIFTDEVQRKLNIEWNDAINLYDQYSKFILRKAG